MDDLDVRLKMVNFCLEVLRTTDEPETPDAIAYYEEQKRAIEQKIKERDNKPQDIVIGLKPAILFGKSENK